MDTRPHGLPIPEADMRVMGWILPELRRSTALAAAALVGTALTQPLHAQQATVRDSAGVRIVQNSSRLKAPVVFALDTTPIYDIGGIEANPDEEFTHNQGYLRGVRLSNGGYAVIDVVRVHFFDVHGKRVKIVGRQGAGPQEFQYLTTICRTRGDTLIVGDGHNRRVAVLDGTGTIIRTIPQGDLGGPGFEFCFDDGSFLLARSVASAPTAPRAVRLTRVRTDGSVVGVLGEFSTRVFDMISQSEETIVPHGQRLYYGDANTSELRIFDVTGKLTEIVRTNDPPVRISDAEVEERIASTIPPNTPASERTARLQRLRAMPRASTWPAFRDALVDASGRIWMRDYQTRDAPEVWTVFDTTGRMLGRLQLPPRPPKTPRMQVLSFGTNDALVRRFDDDQASHLTVYRIVRKQR